MLPGAEGRYTGTGGSKSTGGSATGSGGTAMARSLAAARSGAASKRFVREPLPPQEDRLKNIGGPLNEYGPYPGILPSYANPDQPSFRGKPTPGRLQQISDTVMSLRGMQPRAYGGMTQGFGASGGMTDMLRRLLLQRGMNL